MGQNSLLKIQIGSCHSLSEILQCFSFAIRPKSRPFTIAYMALQDMAPAPLWLAIFPPSSPASLSPHYTDLSISQTRQTPSHLRAFALTVLSAWEDQPSELCVAAAFQHSASCALTLHSTASILFPKSYLPLSEITLFTCFFIIVGLVPLASHCPVELSAIMEMFSLLRNSYMWLWALEMWPMRNKYVLCGFIKKSTKY